MKKELSRIQGAIDELEAKRKLFDKLSTICPSCDGTGQERYMDAAGSRDYRECLTCNGVGKIAPIKCRCGNIIGVDMIAVRREPSSTCPWCGARL